MDRYIVGFGYPIGRDKGYVNDSLVLQQGNRLLASPRP
jgi:hypothetical protein